MPFRSLTGQAIQRPLQISFLILLLCIFPAGSQGSSRNLGSDESTKICIKNGYFDCNQCPCENTEDSRLLSIIFSCFSVLFSLVVIFGFFMVREMREQPGDIVLGVAISNIIFCCGLITECFKDMDFDLFSSFDGEENEDEKCLVLGSIRTVALFLINYYHISFSAFYLVTLRGSLKSRSVSPIIYHAFPFIGVGLTWFWFYNSGAIGKHLTGICGIKTMPGLTFPIINYGSVVIVTVLLTCFIRRYLPKNERISDLRSKFLKFYLKFVILIVVTYLAVGIVEAQIGNIANDFSTGSTSIDGITKLNYIKTFKSLLNGLNPLVLSIARMVDPLMRSHWKQLFYIMRRGARRVSRNATFFDSRRVSLDLYSTQKSIERRSHIFQFQHSRRVQAMYSLLFAIHYFWHSKEEKRLDLIDNPKKNKVPEDQKEREAFYKKQAYSKEHFPIDNQTMGKVLPELFDEMRQRSYDIDPGTFTVHAPDIFSEIIDLDEIGRGIKNSLDPNENFNRILKSGINGGGRSGEFFFFSSDNQIIIKTISNSELNVLLRILPAYLKHFKENPDSVIAKIYGVFTLRVQSPKERYNLILMRNINGVPTEFVKRKYDLKGSTVGRRAVKLKEEPSKSDLQFKNNMKDLDFERFEGKVHASYNLQLDLIEVMKKDAEFLASQNLIDYSLALYLVDKEAYVQSTKHMEKSTESGGSGSTNQSSEKGMNITLSDLPDSRSSSFLSGTTPRNFRDSLLFMKSTQEELDYHLGIIDYLIEFSLYKKLELFFKKLVVLNPNYNISVQRPYVYSKRFVKYMEKIFLDENTE